MRYMMRKGLFSLGDRFVIKTAQGKDAFQVRSKVFSLGRQLSFLDMTGKELAYVKEKLLAWGPTFEIYRAGVRFAVLRRNLAAYFTRSIFSNNRFTIELPRRRKLIVEGDYFNHDYTITREGRMMAMISQSWFSTTETYGVDVMNEYEDDAPLMLACTVAIEQTCPKRKT